MHTEAETLAARILGVVTDGQLGGLFPPVIKEPSEWWLMDRKVGEEYWLEMVTRIEEHLRKHDEALRAGTPWVG